MTDWKKVQGSQQEKPKEWDTTTSATVVYQRRNIERKTVKDMNGQTAEFWEYEEREMSREEYSVLIAGVQQEKISQVDETAIAGLMAVTDLYEELLSKGVL